MPPDGFQPTDLMPGFARPDRSAGIEVTEIQGPYSEVRAGLESKEGFKRQGMTLVDVDHPSIAGSIGVAVHVTQAQNGIEIHKLMAAFGDGKHTAIVTGVYRNDEPETNRKSIQAALLTARWSKGANPGTFEGLHFRITESPTLKIQQRASTLLILGPAGLSGPIPPGQPSLVVATAPSAPSDSQLEAYAKQAVTQMKSLVDVHNIEGSTTRVDGLPAFELTADAHRNDSPDPVRVYELMVADFGAQRSYFALGLVSAADSEKSMADFKTVAHSLEVEQSSGVSPTKRGAHQN